jgi:hypothetical protein
MLAMITGLFYRPKHRKSLRAAVRAYAASVDMLTAQMRSLTTLTNDRSIAS